MKTIATGGYATYGQALGILMLDTRFPRIQGDIGNASTFPFPVRYAKVPGASPRRVVKEGDPSLLGPFIEAARVAGGSPRWIIGRHLVPHLIPYLAVQVLAGVTGALIVQGFVEYNAGGTRVDWVVRNRGPHPVRVRRVGVELRLAGLPLRRTGKLRLDPK